MGVHTYIIFLNYFYKKLLQMMKIISKNHEKSPSNPNKLMHEINGHFSLLSALLLPQVWIIIYFVFFTR